MNLMGTKRPLTRGGAHWRISCGPCTGVTCPRGGSFSSAPAFRTTCEQRLALCHVICTNRFGLGVLRRGAGRFCCHRLSPPLFFLHLYLLEPLLVLRELQLVHFFLVFQKLVVLLLAFFVLIAIKLTQGRKLLFNAKIAGVGTGAGGPAWPHPSGGCGLQSRQRLPSWEDRPRRETFETCNTQWASPQSLCCFLHARPKRARTSILPR